jgi:zinc-ribbon domain
MFCPKCATQNLDGASFCRSCGANISLVPQALTGQLPRADEDKSVTTQDDSCFTSSRRKRELTLDQAFRYMFMGIAFLIISIALSRSIGAGWWFWMLIPAFSLMGTGVAQYIRLRELQNRSIPTLPPRAVRSTEHFIPPPAPAPSVTEGTTRHLSSKTSEHR